MEELFSKIGFPLKSKAIFYIVLGCIFIAFGPFFVEFSGTEAITSSFYRLVIGAVAFLIIAWLQKEKMPKARYFWLYLLAGLTITFDLVACNQSILYIGSGLSTILSNLEIVFLLIFGFIFFNERLPRAYFQMCLLILLGICCLVQPYFLEIHPDQFLGILFALGASFIYAIYLLLLKVIGKKNSASSPAATLGLVCFWGAIILGAFIAWSPQATFYLPNEWQSIFCILAYSILSQVFGWWFITKGLNEVSLSISGIIFLTQPALTFICDCLFLGRNTHWFQLLGGTILIVTVYLTIKEEKSNFETSSV